MQTLLVTGASRGIGLALTKHFVFMGHTVIATCRDPQGAKELKALASGTADTQNGIKGKVTVHQLDVSVCLSQASRASVTPVQKAYIVSLQVWRRPSPSSRPQRSSRPSHTQQMSYHQERLEMPARKYGVFGRQVYEPDYSSRLGEGDYDFRSSHGRQTVPCLCDQTQVSVNSTLGNNEFVFLPECDTVRTNLLKRAQRLTTHHKHIEAPDARVRSEGISAHHAHTRAWQAESGLTDRTITTCAKSSVCATDRLVANQALSSRSVFDAWIVKTTKRTDSSKAAQPNPKSVSHKAIQKRQRAAAAAAPQATAAAAAAASEEKDDDQPMAVDPPAAAAAAASKSPLQLALEQTQSDGRVIRRTNDNEAVALPAWVELDPLFHPQATRWEDDASEEDDAAPHLPAEQGGRRVPDDRTQSEFRAWGKHLCTRVRRVGSTAQQPHYFCTVAEVDDLWSDFEVLRTWSLVRKHPDLVRKAFKDPIDNNTQSAFLKAVGAVMGYTQVHRLRHGYSWNIGTTCANTNDATGRLGVYANLAIRISVAYYSPDHMRNLHINDWLDAMRAIPFIAAVGNARGDLKKALNIGVKAYNELATRQANIDAIYRHEYNETRRAAMGGFRLSRSETDPFTAAHVTPNATQAISMGGFELLASGHLWREWSADPFFVERFDTSKARGASKCQLFRKLTLEFIKSVPNADLHKSMREILGGAPLRDVVRRTSHPKFVGRVEAISNLRFVEPQQHLSFSTTRHFLPSGIPRIYNSELRFTTTIFNYGHEEALTVMLARIESLTSKGLIDATPFNSPSDFPHAAKLDKDNREGKKTYWGVYVSSTTKPFKVGIDFQSIATHTRRTVAEIRAAVSEALGRPVQADAKTTCVKMPKAKTSKQALAIADVTLAQLKRQRILFGKSEAGIAHSIKDALKSVQKEGIDTIDCLICNAGIATEGHPNDSAQSCDRAAMLHVFDVNVAGVLDCIQTFTPLLRRSDKRLVLCISSRLGSIELNDTGNITAYRVSKAALNMLVKTFAVDEAKRQISDGLAVVAVHPGWTDTDMGRSGDRKPPLPLNECVEGIAKLMAECSAKDSGKFVQWDGQELPW
ncbi:unnamed protein product [Vitrella brassicaformis CCMP3155]|uniref:Uncharacterized protein n=1 Tax=Vitrella brassicaformis (strain CCMP3155) TaxID=1169540 RepID=A0A0G4EKE1_VITBC|nr:unnamed protein product [Vitrella brassicaformis CCMP3155]|eukprot:CEL97025.1 unnamed protein product [Vitrella brassicaformis CCMP3155]